MIRTRRIVAVLCFGVVAMGGCDQKDDAPKTIHVRGAIEKIDLANKTVQVRAFSKKHKQELVHTVHVNDDTEIMINGAIAKMTDVRVGETAVGAITIVKEDNQRKLIATRVEVEREEALLAPTAREGADESDGE